MERARDKVESRVPFSQRRHRLNPGEIYPVLEAVEFRLRQLISEKSDLPSARSFNA